MAGVIDVIAEPRDLRWDPLLVCVAAYIATTVARIHQLFGFLEPLHLAVVTGVLALLLFVRDDREERRLRHVLLPTVRLLGLLFFWMVLTIPTALNAGNSVDLVFNNFIKTAAMSLVVAASIRSLRDVERLVAVYFVGALIYSAVILSRFDVGTSTDSWRLGRLYYYDANDFATFIVTAIPFGVYLLHAGRRPAHKLCAAGGLVILMLAFVWSGSRGGFIALGAVVLYIALRYSAIPLRWRVGAPALVALVLMATASDQYWQQMQTITSDTDYNHTSETGRLQIWSRGVGYMMANPMLGVGPQNFQTAEGVLSPLAALQQFGIGVRWNAPHNSFVQAGAELGMPGLALYIAFIASAFAALRRTARIERRWPPNDANRPRLSPALTASLLGFVVGAFFLSLTYSEMLYTLVALAVGLEKVAHGAAV